MEPQDGYPFQRIIVDFVGPLRPSHKGNKYILTIKDTFSRWVEAIPGTHADARTVAGVLEKAGSTVFVKMMGPQSVLAEQLGAFTSLCQSVQ